MAADPLPTRSVSAVVEVYVRIDVMSKTVEDYLLNIYTIASEGRPVIAARLAEALDVAPPTVTATLHRMTRDGLIEVNPHKEVVLTDHGHQLAETMVRRHRLAERLLVDLLGLDWADVHEEAHRFEHAISPRVEARILAVLGDPTTCPHGSPIPGTGAVLSRDAVRLEETKAGDRVVVDRIAEDAENDRDLLGYFHGWRRRRPATAWWLIGSPRMRRMTATCSVTFSRPAFCRAGSSTWQRSSPSTR
jgi:DtxR family transcriptional regulator, Mn-dependent transcriptional regulator